MILEIFPSGPLETNAILIGCSLTKRAVVIDAPFESTQKVQRRVRELSLQVEKILLTHSHWDHIGEAAQMKAELKAPIYVHPDDAANLEEPGSDGLPLYFPIEGVAPDGFLSEGETILVGTLEIQVIHTPGHTAGSVCFYIPGESVVITGDTLFRGSIGRLNFPKSRPDLMADSLKKLAKLPSETKVVPGHGSSTTIGAENWLHRAQEKFGF